VGTALIGLGLVLTAVFVPAAFVPGIAGQFYQQFALTIATATVISVLVSLTLSPALCALLLRPHGEQHATPNPAGPPRRQVLHGVQPWSRRLASSYAGVIARLVRHGALVGVVYLLLLALTGCSSRRFPRGSFPPRIRDTPSLPLSCPLALTSSGRMRWCARWRIGCST
jgi:HAE1 family hydrophobic/amphiphilic exporter-1